MPTKTSDRADLSFAVTENVQVSAILERPRDAQYILVLAHGAGAGMEHPFLESLAHQLSVIGIATFRYQFPYMEQRRRVPDSPKVLTATVRAAITKAAALCPHLTILAGGKSMGGRMTSTAAEGEKLPGVRGIVFVGFPLHPPNKPSTNRAEHLKKVAIPMLFLQGTRDTLADLKLLRTICEELGEHATLRVIDTADHSFHVLKSSGKTDAETLRLLAHEILDWANSLK